LSKTHFEDYVVNIKPDIGTKSINMYKTHVKTHKACVEHLIQALFRCRVNWIMYLKVAQRTPSIDTKGN
jgi:hypothetical protein